MGWNDTAAAGGRLAAGGGGVSGLFPKPSWQAGTGVPKDGSRDLPDIAFASSSAHDGYLGCSQGSCVNGYRAADGTLTVLGGTSAGAPAFAGVLALLNQKTRQFQGNVNPSLYTLAVSAPEAFHDVTTGNNRVPCAIGTVDCPSGGTIGYDATAGYDLATGLGSVDAGNLLNAWPVTTSPVSDFQLTAASAKLSVTHGTTGTDRLTVTAVNGFSGDVVLTCATSVSLAGATCAVSPSTVAGTGTATLMVTAPAHIAALSGRVWGGENALVLAAGLLFSVGKSTASRGRLKRLGSGLLLAVVLIALLAAWGCGTNSTTTTSSPVLGATPVTGTVTVQAGSGSVIHTLNVAVTLN
jgi:hypothetical protein